jgi:ribosomal protein L12E/L44/L45/RPP1/RPP2
LTWLLRTARRILPLCLAGLALSAAPLALAQADDNTMTASEVEKLRDAAYVPNDRIDAYIKILDSRAKSIDDLLAKRRHAGREQDLHDIFDQMGAIADELNDNLEEYSPKHRDLRKVLPKLLSATERWSTSLRAAPDDPAYKVVRKIALDAVQDVHDAAATMQTDQVAYYKAHPEAAQAEKNRENPAEQKPIDIPR